MTGKLLFLIPTSVTIIVGIVVLSTSLFSSVDHTIVEVGKSSFYSDKIKINDKIVELQIADEPLERNIGLMSQEKLPYDKGMLFIYEEPGNYSFWMYKMEFALDIIWFDEKGNVVHIEQDVPPCKTEPEYCKLYDPQQDALYVFEAAAGFVEMFGIDKNSMFFWVVEKNY